MMVSFSSIIAFDHFVNNQFRGSVDLSKLSVTDLKEIREYYESRGNDDLAKMYK